MAGPEKIGDYEIRRQIGAGGMGVVYEGFDPRLKRKVAIKILNLQSPTAIARFEREGQTSAQLSHPNVVSLFDVGRHEGRPYLVQEYLDGADLSKVLRLRGEPLPICVQLAVLSQVAAGLEAAHASNIVHRDVKPGNVRILADGRLKLMDFGIARLHDEQEERLTSEGLMAGTPGYIAPEVLDGKRGGPEADVYGIGALAFELVTGRRPFEGASPAALMMKTVSEDAPRASEFAPDCPPALDELIVGCLHRDPAGRPADLGAVASTLLDLHAELDCDDPHSELQRILSELDEPDPLPPPAAAAPITAIEPAPAPANWAHDGTIIAPVVAGREPTDETLPRPLGRFTLHEFIAEGRTGNLYKAFDPMRGRLVGLKVLHGDESEPQQRLLRAARIWLDVQHPHLLRVLEAHPGDAQVQPWVATELIEGRDLATTLESRLLTLQQKVSIAVQLCDALQYLHDRDIVHREVKPRNILVSGDELRVTLLDSGIARQANPGLDALTRTGIVVGDLHYMAPEQAAGRLDQRADVFSAGAVLYELLFQEPPSFQRLDAMRAQVEASELPERLRGTLLGALTADPATRFARAGEFGDLLRQFVPSTTPPPDLERIVVTLHGIRTHARWQRAFAEVASQADLHCRLDRWCFGYFSVFRFLLPWPRRARVAWFRHTYQEEFGDRPNAPLSRARPSIVAHSFGTYILGNALLRYPYLRFDKILLCGSILPTDFPWAELIASGQVQSVRNEYGSRDVWTRFVAWFVPGTGASGLRGFDAEHDHIQQERFDFSHSEYFEKSHMENCWLAFLKTRTRFIDPHDRTIDESRPLGSRPWALWLLYALAIAGVAWAIAG